MAACDPGARGDIVSFFMRLHRRPAHTESRVQDSAWQTQGANRFPAHSQRHASLAHLPRPVCSAELPADTSPVQSYDVLEMHLFEGHFIIEQLWNCQVNPRQVSRMWESNHAIYLNR
jgi:hypothetical protein